MSSLSFLAKSCYTKKRFFIQEILFIHFFISLFKPIIFCKGAWKDQRTKFGMQSGWPQAPVTARCWCWDKHIQGF